MATMVSPVPTTAKGWVEQGLHHPLQTLKEGAAALGGLLLDIHVPTTTPHMSEADRDQIVAAVQPGDVCIETNDAYPEWQRMEYVTMRSAHTHAFIYEGNGKMLQSTTPDGVQRTDLKDYLKGQIHVCVIRPAYQSPDDVKAALDFAAKQIGKPYNYDFDMTRTDKYYCSQLVEDALKHMPHPIETPLVEFDHRQAVAPDGFKQLPNAKIVIDDHVTFWKNQLRHGPVAAGALAAGVGTGTAAGLTAGLAAGLVAGPVGFVAGLALSICIGNKIQTGHFGFGQGASEEA